jgi:hypothetical protein
MLNAFAVGSLRRFWAAGQLEQRSRGTEELRVEGLRGETCRIAELPSARPWTHPRFTGLLPPPRIQFCDTAD